MDTSLRQMYSAAVADRSGVTMLSSIIHAFSTVGLNLAKSAANWLQAPVLYPTAHEITVFSQ